MAGQKGEKKGVKKAEKKENAIVRYLRDTRAELRKVYWPSREEAWRLTLVVLAVTVSMALFLWALDAYFAWLLRIAATQSSLALVMGLITVGALVGSAVWIGRGEEI